MTDSQKIEIGIIDTGEALIEDLVANAANWRLHPVRQQAATKEAMQRVGWLDKVLVNLREGPAWDGNELQGVKGIVDGHMRVDIALEAGDRSVPVDYCNLTPADEAYALATLDPLGALAKTDEDALRDLTSQLDEDTKSVRAALRAAGLESRAKLAVLAGDNGQGAAGSQPGAESSSNDGLNQPEIAKGTQSTQKPEQKYPLAIVLSKQELSQWQAYKDRVGIKTDTPAFLDLLRATLENV